MYRILKIGMDVHITNYTLCAMEDIFGEDGKVLAQITIAPDYKLILNFINRVKGKMDPKGKDEINVECGYEAGCLGYSLYHHLTNAGVKCVIMAPTTMMTEKGKRVKTDRRDARLIAKCLCYGSSSIHSSSCHWYCMQR